MSQQFEIKAKSRTEHGKAAARRLRHQELIPAIVYGANQEPAQITIEHSEILKALKNEAIHSQLIDLSIDQKSEKVVLKAVQRHAFKPKILHLDFQRINTTEKLTMHIPLHFIGEAQSEAIKSGASLSKVMTDIEIRCLPQHLPEFFEIDITDLPLDHVIHLSDLKLPQGVELTTEIDETHNPTIAMIQVLKAAAEAEPEAEAGDEATSDEATDPSSDSEES